MLALCVLLVLLAVLSLLWWGSSTFGHLPSLPGPRPLPVVGNVLAFHGLNQLEVDRTLVKTYGGVVRFFIGRKPLVMLSDPQMVHEVTVKASDQFRNRPQAEIRSRNSSGLLQARDEYWKRLRRTIAPTFNVMHLKTMLPPMHEEIKIFISKLDEACDAQREVDIHEMFTKLTLDIIGRVAFGTKLNAQLNTDNTFLRASSVLFRNTPRNNGLAALLFPRLWLLKHKLWPSQQWRELLRAVSMLDELSLSLIRKRKAERERKQDAPSEQCVPNDFLDLLFDARDKSTGEGLTEEEIRDQANTFLLAGHETTANTLAYTALLLSQHPEVDEKLFSELKEQFGEQDDALDLNQLSLMHHLNMVLMESLRMYPPATRTVREANADVVIGEKYLIPKGTTVVIPIKEIGNNDQLWPEPKKFLPFERWAEDEGVSSDKKHALIWLPFGAGPRNCIGQRFALIEAKLVLAHLLRRFKLQLSPGQKLPLELQPGITTSPKHGIKVLLHRRT